MPSLMIGGLYDFKAQCHLFWLRSSCVLVMIIGMDRMLTKLVLGHHHRDYTAMFDHT